MIALCEAMFNTSRHARPMCRASTTLGQREDEDVDGRNKSGHDGLPISNKLQRDAAEGAEIGVQRVALPGEHHARERTGEYEMARLERHAMRAQLVGEPGDAERRMAEHAGGDAGLLDLRVTVHDAADPAQIDVERTDRPAADDDAGGGAVVGYGVE